MAQAAVNAVIQAFQRGMEQVQQAKAQKQQREEFETTLEQHKAEFAAQKEQQKIANEAADKLFALHKANYEAQQAQTDFANAAVFQRSGITPPGTQVVPGLQAAPQPSQLQIPQITGQPAAPQVPQPERPPLVLSDLQNTQLIPRSGQAQIVPPLSQNPEQQLIQQQQREAEARKIRETRQLQIAEQERQIAVNRATQAEQGKRLIEMAGVEHGYKTQEIAQQLQGNKEIERMRNASAFEVAKLRAGGDLSDFAQMPGAADTLTRLKMGTMSQEEVARSPFKKQLSTYALQNNIQILPKTKSDQIAALETMGNLLPTIRRMIYARSAHPLDVNNPLSDVGQQYDSDVKSVRSAAPQASVAMTGVRRFTQAELSRFDDFFTPGKTPLVSGTKANLSKYNEFASDLSQAMQQVTKGLSDEQTSSILSNLRSKGLTYLQIQNPQEQEQQAPTLKVWQVNPQTGQLELKLQKPAGQ